MDEKHLLALLDEAVWKQGWMHVDTCEFWEQMKGKHKELWVKRRPRLASSDAAA